MVAKAEPMVLKKVAKTYDSRAANAPVILDGIDLTISDGEIIAMSQEGFSHSPNEDAVVIMGGRGIESVDHMVTEVGIRGMYRYWREVMGAS